MTKIELSEEELDAPLLPDWQIVGLDENGEESLIDRAPGDGPMPVSFRDLLEVVQMAEYDDSYTISKGECGELVVHDEDGEFVTAVWFSPGGTE